MKTLWGAFFSLIVVIIFLTFASTIATEAGAKNANLDSESVQLIVDLNYEVETYNADYVSNGESNVTADSSFEGVDAFSRQYLEDKSEITQRKNQVEKVLGVPELMIRSLGIENNSVIVTLQLLIVALMTFAIGLGVYKAVRTGETG